MRRSLALYSIIMSCIFLFGISISPASGREERYKGLPWLILLKDSTAPLLLTPYVNESDMKDIGSIFNSDKNSPWPWSRIHDGFDIYPQGDLKPFQAVCSGRVDWMYEGDEQVIVFLACNSEYIVEYNFETQKPGTGAAQLAHINVAEGQIVSQGDLIGSLYTADPDKAHVHICLWRNWIPICPEPYFTQGAKASMLDLLHVAWPGSDLCYGGDVSPPPFVTPYVNESNMEKISTAFSSADSSPPWGFVHDGIDIHPKGNQEPFFQAACSGIVDSIDTVLDPVDSNYQVELLITCDNYVQDPDNGGYFIPFSTQYIFETMSDNSLSGFSQRLNILSKVGGEGEAVTQGQVVGSLLAWQNSKAHVQFNLLQFGSSFFQGLGVEGIPICPKPHFSSAARSSITTLLHVAWPGAGICYQE